MSEARITRHARRRPILASGPGARTPVHRQRRLDHARPRQAFRL